LPQVVAAAVLSIVAGAATPVFAQSAAFPRAKTVEISGGVTVVGGYDFGTSNAELTPNAGTPPAFVEFKTTNRLKPGLGLQGRIGFVITPALAVEGGIRFTRPTYEARVTDDFEGAPDTTIEETLSQYVFDGAVVWHITGARFAGGSAVPFLYGGAGYLRELHEENAFVEEGVEYHAGGGIKWWFGQSGRIGIRAEGGISIRDGGFDFKDGQRIVPVAGASVLYSF
jgi:hypothetical protein